MHHKYDLVLAANRDEFYSRPARPLSFWKENADILAGQDLCGKGTWLGVNRSGRFAAVTNYREPQVKKANAPSRGMLVREFLSCKVSPQEYIDSIKPVSHRYNGFNLLLGDQSGIFYFSNRAYGSMKLMPGIYGLSNHLLDTAWPKVKRGKEALRKLITEAHPISIPSLFAILSDRFCPPDHELPDTGVGVEWERTLSPPFVSSPNYGTRSSSVLLIDSSGKVLFIERTYVPGTKWIEVSDIRKFRFQI